VQSTTDTFSESSYSPDENKRRGDWNAWIEIALLWLAVILIIACWR
jgi:hypothetical protein